MAVLALAVAYASLSLDFFLLGQRYQYQLWRLFSGDAETARNLLSTLLSSIITVTSLVVSITIVVSVACCRAARSPCHLELHRARFKP